MESTTLHHSGWAAVPSFASSDPFSPYQHDRWKDIYNGPEQTIDLSHMLDPNSHPTIDASNHDTQTPFATTRREDHREGSISAEQNSQESLWPREQLQFDAFQQGGDPPLFRQDTSQSVWTGIMPSIERPCESVKAGDNSTSRPVAKTGFAKRRRGRPRLHPSPTGLNDFDVSSDTIPDSRRSQLEKNRVAADKCRRRRKEYTTGLLTEVSTLSSKNEGLKAEEASLREELLRIKNEILRHAGCGSPIIDGYIARTAGSQLITKAKSKVLPRRDSGHGSSGGHSDDTPRDIVARKMSRAFSDPKKPSYHVAKGAYDVFELLEEFVHTGENK